ncbi:hypothetical protein IVG45_06305 [Methylomonas sp. LL1]|uniref:hypothetical protein n=1 Tax=Methylomonas sp. LL1 TaxID=2785785 RepID=UPI0018C3D165|nr:hypothetical protein [Methylomonas sp. LL1]QPK64565.1 hypothetical protein IVG45_06305 [Methylomonas sp. LL1]
MQKDKGMPLWVFLALSSIETRKGALILIWSSLLFSAYCIPWVNYFENNGWIKNLFLIDDWEWFSMMLPMTLWYWLSMKWVDKNRGWGLASNIREDQPG